LKNEDVEKMLNKHFSMAAPPTDFWNTVVGDRQSFVDTAKEEHNRVGNLEGMADGFLRKSATDPMSLWIKSPDDNNDMNRKNVFKWVRSSLKKKPENVREAILNDLEEISKDKVNDVEQVKELHCNNTVKTFYVGHANFRHKGEAQKRPPKVFLNKPEADQDDKVWVYYTNSGSGKTVELAASGYLRGGVMSIMNKVSKDIPTRDNTESRKTECRKALISCLDDIVKTNKATFETLIKSMNAWEKTTEPVRIVFCIDEASSCPNLLRAIISEYEALSGELGNYIASGFGGAIDTTKKNAIQVLFSVAGTGAYQGSSGSLGDNYQYLTPTGNVVGEDLYKTLTSEYEDNDHNKIGTLPGFKDLQDAPFLWIIMQYNARMASILIDQMYNSQLRYNHPHEETRLMSLVFEKYVRSNGMHFLWHSQGDSDQSKLNTTSNRLHVASMGLATYLYPQPVTIPAGEDEISELALGLDYGIRFQSFSAQEGKAKAETRSGSGSTDADVPCDSNVTGNKEKRRRTLMDLLVRECGLVTQEQFSKKTEDNVLEQPFIVNEAMQLLCVWLMQGGQRLKSTESLLGTTPFAFEVLSTQLVSCAISAAMTVQVEHRPKVHEILTKSLGMFRNKCMLGKEEKPFLDPYVETSWAALENVIPVSIKCDLAMDGMYHHKSPMLLKAKPESKGDDKLDTSKTGGKTPATRTSTKPKNSEAWANVATMAIRKGDTLDLDSLKDLEEKKDFDAAVASSQQEETLTMDRDMLIGLTQMRQNKDCDGTPQYFTPSLCSVAEGNSNLADGTVSFIGAKWNEREEKLEDHAMYTICVQAKDIFGKSLKMEKVHNNLNRVKHDLNNIPFGENRMYCVASRAHLVTRARVNLDNGFTDGKRNDDMPKLETKISPFVSYPTDGTKILSGVMEAIDERRNRQEKIVKHGVMLKYEEE